ncbi:hypothetical protein [Arthrobacter sp. H35-D1]|uniref:hypothetical protein n=1 Tax=Arthrobacter sp. H35-D1 TaxID=3046202 RepID=UPI0024BA0DAD|nr:hypothetical protein [Arthrobacter sp. H35-D1]MDJ0315454.1 hypothetical protein [Arthrobacter sp. H35-D1]
MTTNDARRQENPEILLVVGSIRARGTKYGSDLRLSPAGQSQQGPKVPPLIFYIENLPALSSFFGESRSSLAVIFFQRVGAKVAKLRCFFSGHGEAVDSTMLSL